MARWWIAGATTSWWRAAGSMPAWSKSSSSRSARRRRRRRVDAVALELSSQRAVERLLPHHQIAAQRPDRIGEGRRSVVLDEEVADPGEAIAGHGSGDEEGDQPPGAAEQTDGNAG